jgi:hypothetical protein
VESVSASTDRPQRRAGRIIGGVAFVLAPWLTLGFGTPIAFITAAALFSHVGRAHAAVLRLSAVLYTVAFVVEIAESDSQAGTPGDYAFTTCMVVLMAGGGLEALVLTTIAAARGHRPGRSRKVRSEAATRWRSLAALVLLCLLTGVGGALALGVGAVQLPVAVRAARGQGVPGVVTPTERNCGGGATSPCSWRGDFVSDDGQVRLHRADISGHVGGMGEPQPAIYVAGGLDPTVYPPDGSWEWAQWVLVIGFGGALWWMTVVLVVGGWSTDRAARRHRQSPPSSDGDGPGGGGAHEHRP